MLTTRDGWNVSYETRSMGGDIIQGVTLCVFRRTSGKSERCAHCDKQLFDTEDEAEAHALAHGHLKEFSWLTFGPQVETAKPIAPATRSEPLETGRVEDALATCVHAD